MDKTESKDIYELLSTIQASLKAPKNQYNSYGDFHYRSLEDIQGAIKPLLNGAVVLLEDEVVLTGDRYYIKAIATLYYKGNAISVSALAREPFEKKGMDSAQITGATSSYARKYAMNGLFAIDDVKDPDTNEGNPKKEAIAPKTGKTIVEKSKDLVKPKADQVLYAQIWAKIIASKDTDELAVQAKRIVENEHLLNAEMIDKLAKAGAKKKKELNTTNKVT